MVRVGAQRLEIGAGAGGERPAGGPRLLGVPRHEHQRARWSAAPAERPRRLDEHAHAAAVVVRTGRVGRGVVMGAHHHEVGTVAPQDADHVRAGPVVGGERLQPHLGQAGGTELRLHVLGGHGGPR
jgi:hypothetical protein